jgi:spermidine/putrescine transport system permease protein
MPSDDGLGRARSVASRPRVPVAMQRQTRRDWPATLGLLAPAYGVLLIAVFLPLAVMAFFSFLKQAPFGGRPLVFTLEHYLAFVNRPYLIDVAWRSISLGLWTTGLSIAIGLPAALALARATRGRARETIFILIILPFWSNGLVRVFSWTMVLRDGGIIDAGLRWLLPSLPPLGLLYSFPAMVVGLVHAYLPYMILTCYLSILAIDDKIVEAAASLGARSFTIFRTIVLPLALPGVMSGAVLIFVPVIGSFMEPRILGGKVGVTMGTVIEDQFVQGFNWPLGSALSFTMLAVVLVLLGAFSRVPRPRPTA